MRALEAYRARVREPVDPRRVMREHALAALEQYGWGLRAPGEHHRTGRTLEQTHAWVLQAVANAIVER
jgi:hypothetical protein